MTPQDERVRVFWPMDYCERCDGDGDVCSDCGDPEAWCDRGEYCSRLCQYGDGTGDAGYRAAGGCDGPR